MGTIKSSKKYTPKVGKKGGAKKISGKTKRVVQKSSKVGFKPFKGMSMKGGVMKKG